MADESDTDRDEKGEFLDFKVVMGDEYSETFQAPDTFTFAEVIQTAIDDHGLVLPEGMEIDELTITVLGLKYYPDDLALSLDTGAIVLSYPGMGQEEDES